MYTITEGDAVIKICPVYSSNGFEKCISVRCMAWIKYLGEEWENLKDHGYCSLLHNRN